MNREEIKELQKELDLRKYTSSCLARCDMSGKVDYCKGCIFRNDKHECEIPHEVRSNYKVCERQFFKLEKEVKQSVKKNTRTTNRRKS